MNFPAWTSRAGGCVRWPSRGLETGSGRIRPGLGGYGEAGSTNSSEAESSAVRDCCRCSSQGGRNFGYGRPGSIFRFPSGFFPCIAGHCPRVFLCDWGTIHSSRASSPATCIRGVAMSFPPVGFLGRSPRSSRNQKRSKHFAMTAFRDCASRHRPFAVWRAGAWIPMAAACEAFWVKVAVSGLAGRSSSGAGKRWMYVFVSTVLCNGP